MHRPRVSARDHVMTAWQAHAHHEDPTEIALKHDRFHSFGMDHGRTVQKLSKDIAAMHSQMVQHEPHYHTIRALREQFYHTAPRNLL